MLFIGTYNNQAHRYAWTTGHQLAVSLFFLLAFEALQRVTGVFRNTKIGDISCRGDPLSSRLMNGG